MEQGVNNNSQGKLQWPEPYFASSTNITLSTRTRGICYSLISAQNIAGHRRKTNDQIRTAWDVLNLFLAGKSAVDGVVVWWSWSSIFSALAQGATWVFCRLLKECSDAYQRFSAISCLVKMKMKMRAGLEEVFPYERLR